MTPDRLRKVGLGGVLLAVLCCAAGPLLGAGLAAIGIGVAVPTLSYVLVPLGLMGIALYGYAMLRERDKGTPPHTHLSESEERISQ